MKKLALFLSLAIAAIPVLAKNATLDEAHGLYQAACASKTNSVVAFEKAKKKYLSAKGDVGYTPADQKAIRAGVQKCDRAIKQIRGASRNDNAGLPTYTAPVAAGPKLTVNGSATPTVSVEGDGGVRELSISTNQGDPLVYDVPSWMWVTDVTPTSMKLMWDDNNSPNPRKDSFKVTAGSKTVTVTVTQAKGVPNRLQITDAKFANTRGQAILTDFGDPLYADEMRFLTTELTYNGPKTSETKRVNVKIINPNGTLRTTPYSPQGYTYGSDFDFEPGWNQSDYLMGVGRSDCSTYDAGFYRVEIYIEDDLVHTTNLYLNAKGGQVSYLTVNDEEDADSYFVARGESNTMTVRSDGAWTTMNLPEWCSAAKQGDQLILTATYNESSAPRIGSMTVVSGDKKVNVTLRQEGNAR